MSEAALLRVLADRLDELESLKLFPADVVEPGTLTVEWTAGNDHPGYTALSAAISAMVEQHWNALRSQVVKKKETDVQGARKAWSDLSSGLAPEPVAHASADLPPPGIVTPNPMGRVQLIQRQA